MNKKEIVEVELALVDIDFTGPIRQALEKLAAAKEEWENKGFTEIALEPDHYYQAPRSSWTLRGKRLENDEEAAERERQDRRIRDRELRVLRSLLARYPEERFVKPPGPPVAAGKTGKAENGTGDGDS